MVCGELSNDVDGDKESTVLLVKEDVEDEDAMVIAVALEVEGAGGLVVVPDRSLLRVPGCGGLLLPCRPRSTYLTPNNGEEGGDPGCAEFCIMAPSLEQSMSLLLLLAEKDAEDIWCCPVICHLTMVRFVRTEKRGLASFAVGPLRVWLNSLL